MTATTTTAAPSAVQRSSAASTWVNKRVRGIFILPSIIYIAVMIIFPIGYTVFLSFTNAQGAVSRPFRFVGLDNYIYWFTDTARFWPAAGRTVYYTVFALALELLLGLGIALLLRRTFRGQGLVRAAILMPLVATPVAIGMMWLLILEPNIGMANYVLQSLGLSEQGFLTDPGQALNTLIWIDVWQWTPMMALILLAGLTSLPDEPYEAAAVDGANAWQRFRHLTVPMLWPTMAAATMLRAIDALKSFDIIYATKGRGGGSRHEAETLNILAYGESFEYSMYGRASALLMVFLLLIVGSLAVIQILRRAGQR
ncbi:carbohydrate ABC transporter permease [Tessaracoccus sp. ZS01]|uniref:carbohydrate ABC transporter permease n=1 Tax=Tessaracoccus sp. ZS01 TaxID=1906324 RepID=UPI00096D145D|nr:sugar ABC transporter permease [Tessaracoccus sp. ZS01]OMG54060.1 ABC transporter permease [Tessaracoccus sp. ZS01]